MEKRLVILSGKGELPHIFKKLSKEKGYEAFTVGVRGITDRKTDFVVPFLGFKQFEELLLKLERPQIVMLGKFDQKLSVVLYNSLLQKLKSFFFTEQFEENYGIYKVIKEKAKNKQPKELVVSFIRYMEDKGFSFLPSHAIQEIAQPLLAGEGVLAGEIEEKEIEDLKGIFKIAKQIADWDIGQTITVKDGTIVAVEAVEGTNETIKRTCKLVGKGFSVIKVARTVQDFRIDVPTVGMETLKLLKKCRVKNLILEAGKVFIVPKVEFLKEAKKAGIKVIGLVPR
jgi:DUF1009 family protein